MLPCLKEVQLSGCYWTDQRFNQVTRNLTRYTQPLDISLFHINSHSMPVSFFSHLQILSMVKKATFCIGTSDLDLLYSIFPRLENIQILEINMKAATPSRATSSSSSRVTNQVQFRQNQPFIDTTPSRLSSARAFQKHIRNLVNLEHLILGDITVDYLSFSALDPSWLPPKLTKLRCVADHIINTNPSMIRYNYDQIQHLAFTFTPSSHAYVACPFSNLTSLEVMDDWRNHPYQPDLIQEALYLSRQTLKEVKFYALDPPEMIFIARYLKNIEVLKVFKLLENWVHPRFTFNDLMYEFMVNNGAPVSPKLPVKGQVSTIRYRIPPNETGNKFRRLPQYLPKGKLRILTVPIEMKTIIYVELEQFVHHFTTLESLIFFRFYPLLSYSSVSEMSRMIQEKINDLLVIPAIIDAPENATDIPLPSDGPFPLATFQTPVQRMTGKYADSSSSQHSDSLYIPRHLRNIPEHLIHKRNRYLQQYQPNAVITFKQYRKMHQVFRQGCQFCPGNYPKDYIFDNKTSHFFVKPTVIRDNFVFLSREDSTRHKRRASSSSSSSNSSTSSSSSFSHKASFSSGDKSHHHKHKQSSSSKQYSERQTIHRLLN